MLLNLGKLFYFILLSMLLSSCVRTPKDNNVPPLVYAGADKTVALNEYVFLRGTASDSDGTIVSSQWSEGSKILSSSSILKYDTSVAGTHILIFTATDNKGARSSDTLILRVGDTNQVYKKSNTYEVQNLGSSNSISHSVVLGNNPKSLYLVLSNSDTYSYTMRIQKNIPTRAKVARAKESNQIIAPKIIHRPQYVKDFDKELSKLIEESKKAKDREDKIIEPSTARAKDIVGQSKTLYLNQYYKKTTATVRKIIPNVYTNMGSKTLNVLVSNDSFDSGNGCAKVRCVTQTMVDALANTFLKNGLDNDIYDWVSNIFGEEWGDNTGLIPANNEITILLTDIDQDNSANGGVIGFFWSKDNLKKTFYRSSNERIMFYIDSVMFANGSGVWDINDKWPKEVVSTLAHEFQHMISFYQKETLLNTRSEVWLDEMLSETTEDIVATKIQSKGPRGVDYRDGTAGNTSNVSGRYPLFNSYINNLSLTAWSSTAKYSKVSSFGTYLIRNYGGAKLLHDILHNNFSDEQAVVAGVQQSINGRTKTFKDLLHEWGIAVMLSDYTNVSNYPSYNRGGFISNTYNTSTYEMGSINFFNYSPRPYVSTQIGTIPAQGNYFYKIGDNLTGDVNFSLQLNGKTEVSLIIK